ncbi:hypothetical protein B0H13DRAFT_2278030 [Mycena leptocephala]|nr:hypothetical protein B0H13DRAFT_2278030 [Mycena leptocephala]
MSVPQEWVLFSRVIKSSGSKVICSKCPAIKTSVVNWQKERWINGVTESNVLQEKYSRSAKMRERDPAVARYSSAAAPNTETTLNESKSGSVRSTSRRAGAMEKMFDGAEMSSRKFSSKLSPGETKKAKKKGVRVASKSEIEGFPATGMREKRSQNSTTNFVVASKMDGERCVLRPKELSFEHGKRRRVVARVVTTIENSDGGPERWICKGCSSPCPGDMPQIPWW